MAYNFKSSMSNNEIKKILKYSKRQLKKYEERVVKFYSLKVL